MTEQFLLVRESKVTPLEDMGTLLRFLMRIEKTVVMSMESRYGAPYEIDPDTTNKGVVMPQVPVHEPSRNTECLSMPWKQICKYSPD